MKRFCLVLLMLVPATLRAETPVKPRDPGANAALQFWKAVAQYPTLKTEENNLVVKWRETPLNEELAKLLAKCQSSIEFYHRAAESPYCDWGLDYKEGNQLLLPHLQKVLPLSKLVALHAREAFARGDIKTALKDLQSIRTMGRFMAQTPVLIARYVGRAMEALVFDLLAAHATKINLSIADLKDQFKKLPDALTLRDCILHEKKYFVTKTLSDLKEAEKVKPGSWREVWQKRFAGEASMNIDQGISFEEARKMLEEYEVIYDEFIKLLLLPREEIASKYGEFKEKIKAKSPLTTTTLPLFDHMLAEEDNFNVRQEMLFAGIAIAQGGPDQLKNFQDPFGKGPFEYKKLAEGFELQSQLKVKNEPVRMTFK